MDVWVNFTHATKWQAEGIFKCFFPSKPATESSTGATSQEKIDVSQQNLPLPKRKALGHAIPVLEDSEIAELAKRFADAIPEGELSVSPHLESGSGPLTPTSL
jgi:chaperone BCS1